MLVLGFLRPSFEIISTSSGGTLSKVLNNGMELTLAVKLYASDHEGKYPHTLPELLNEGYLENQDSLDKLLSHPVEGPGKPLGWTYFPDLSDKTAPDYPILISPMLQDSSGNTLRKLRRILGKPALFPVDPTWIVRFCDGSGEFMSKKKYEALLKKHSITLPAAETTNTAEK